MAKYRGKALERGIYRNLGGGYMVRIRQKKAEIVRCVETLSDARVLRRQLMSSRRGIDSPGPAKTLGEILNDYADYLDKANKPSDVVRWINRKLTGFFGERHATPLKRRDLEDWASSGTGDYIRRGIVTLRTAHRRADLVVPKAPEYVHEPGHRLYVAEGDVRKFVAAMAWGSPERALTELMLLTSIRLTHILALRVADITGPYIVVRSRKGRGLNRLKIEEHPITHRIREVLSSVVAPDARPESFVVQIGGHRATGHSFRKRLLAASARAGVKPIQSLAWIRNFTITHHIEKGEPIDVVSRMAGHASVLTTRKHYDRAQLLKARVKASESMESFGGGPVFSEGGPPKNSRDLSGDTPDCPVASDDPLGVVEPKPITLN